MPLSNAATVQSQYQSRVLNNSSVQIRKNNHWTAVPNFICQSTVSPIAKAIWLYLLSFKPGSYSPTLIELSMVGHTSRRRCMAYIQELVSLKMMTVERFNRTLPFQYTLNDPAEWLLQDPAWSGNLAVKMDENLEGTFRPLELVVDGTKRPLEQPQTPVLPMDTTPLLKTVLDPKTVLPKEEQNPSTPNDDGLSSTLVETEPVQTDASSLNVVNFSRHSKCHRISAEAVQFVTEHEWLLKKSKDGSYHWGTANSAAEELMSRRSPEWMADFDLYLEDFAHLYRGRLVVKADMFIFLEKEFTKWEQTLGQDYVSVDNHWQIL